jgi:hypothetical protein
MSTDDFFDFNDAGEQRSFDTIPSGTICDLQLTIKPGGGSDDGWLRPAKDGASEGVDCEFTVINGNFANRKIWGLYTIKGTAPKHAEAGVISRKLFCAIVECARGIRPDDKTSEAAKKGRHVNGWGELDGLRFTARIGLRPPKDNYPAKNTILEIITPDRRDWRQIEQLPPDPTKPNNAGNGNYTGAATPAQPAAAIVRPAWAK